MAERYDIAIIGGGIVGLASARAIAELAPGARLVILEKETRLAAHQTSHNSGVIHSGIYYRPGSKKAELCVEGKRLMHEFCAAHGIRVVSCGKIIVATRDDELPRLKNLYERALANRVPVESIDVKRLQRLEPHAAGLHALYSPGTAIVDYAEVARSIVSELSAAGVTIETDAKVTSIRHGREGLDLNTPRITVEARWMVNCAGLYSDVIARLDGLRPGLRIVPFRGEYYLLRPERRSLVRGLIYPVPDPRFPFLGVHFTTTVHGEVEAGPNAVLAFAREGYSMSRVAPGELFATLVFPGVSRMIRRYWRMGVREMYRSLSKRAFVADLQRLVPGIQPDDVVRGGAGVRAQAVTRDGSLLDDFSIVTTDKSIHVLNSPSPAATASLAIGRHIAGLAAAKFNLERRLRA